MSADRIRLRLRERLIELGPDPLIMGIVNASPESFSDGAAVGGVEEQQALARELVDAGADLIDVGGESGVTDRPAVSVAEEIERVAPLIGRLAGDRMTVSVDTWKGAVARAAIEAGASIVNDISGLSDPDVAAACAESGAALVVMHTRVPPKQKQFPGYGDVVADVRSFLAERIRAARALGVEDEQIIVDPGPDFAKTPAETVEVMRRLGELRELGRPLLLAASRKDFVGAITARQPRERLAGTLAAIGWGLDAGVDILRVHDVAAVRDFVAVRAALRGERDVPASLRVDPSLRREAS